MNCRLERWEMWCVLRWEMIQGRICNLVSSLFALRMVVLGGFLLLTAMFWDWLKYAGLMTFAFIFLCIFIVKER
jgi:hypothetical protein